MGPEEIRQYQLYLINEKKVSWSSFNQAVCGLRFLYEITLQRPWEVRHIPFGKRPKKLPVVLSNEEASRLLECISNPKHRAVILTCYAAGLRLREATNLRIADLDGTRAQIRICNGKESKERVVPASPSPIDWLPVRQCPKWAEPSEATGNSQQPVLPTANTDPTASPTSNEPSDPPTSEAQVQRRKSGHQPRKPRRSRRRE